MTTRKSNSLFVQVAAVTVIAFTWSTLHAFGLYWSGFDWQYAIADSAVSNSLNALAVFVLYNTLRFYQPSHSKLVYLFFWNILLAKAISLIFIFVMQQIFSGLFTPVSAVINSTIIFRIAYETLLLTSFSLVIWLWNNNKRQMESDARKSSLEKLAREAELFNLRQQLQPHFLFNSLNSISALAGSQPEQARKMIQQLSDFLRGTLKKDDQQFSTLEKELQHLSLYLEIEKVRFGHRLKTEIIADEQTNKLLLPSLLLQPIVENAIKFGLYDSVGEVLIKIRASAHENYLAIEIQNPFDAATVTAQSGTGFGLSSVQRRLFLLFSRNDLLNTKSIVGEDTNINIFSTTIKIPQS